VAVGLTESGLPVPARIPPQLPVYQSMVSPAPTEPDSVEEAPRQIAAGLAEAVVGAAGSALTVTVTLVHDVLVQPAKGAAVYRARA